MRKIIADVSTGRAINGRIRSFGFLVSLCCGVSSFMASQANAQAAQGGTWAVPQSAARQPSGNAKGGVAVLPPSPTGKLPNPFPSAVIGAPQKPLSNRAMPVDIDQIDGQIGKAISDADARLSGVKLGTGDLKIDQLPVTTLNDDIRAAAMLHRMDVERAEVQGAVDLWGAAYDGKREMPPASNSPSSVTPPVQQPSPTGQNMPISTPQGNPMDRVRQAKEEAIQRAAEEEANRIQDEEKKQEEVRQKRREMASVMPVVSSIAGDPEDAMATILVPFVGERKRVMAGDTIRTYSGRTLTILSVSENGVTVRDGRKTYKLPFGDVAPSPAQGKAMLAEITNPTPAPSSDSANMIASPSGSSVSSQNQDHLITRSVSGPITSMSGMVPRH